MIAILIASVTVTVRIMVAIKDAGVDIDGSIAVIPNTKLTFLLQDVPQLADLRPTEYCDRTFHIQ